MGLTAGGVTPQNTRKNKKASSVWICSGMRPGGDLRNKGTIGTSFSYILVSEFTLGMGF